jgi:hypothetical protein
MKRAGVGGWRGRRGVGPLTNKPTVQRSWPRPGAGRLRNRIRGEDRVGEGAGLRGKTGPVYGRSGGVPGLGQSCQLNDSRRYL